MQKSKARTMLGAAALIGAFALTSCGSEVGTQPTPTASTSQNETQDPKLLELNTNLKDSLGEKYAEGWIAENKLHVAVTDQKSADEVTAAGAVAHLARHSAAELDATISKIMAWQKAQGGSVATAIHKYVPSGRHGTITLAVDPAQLETIKTGLSAADVTGDIALKFTESSGLASPAASS